MQTNPSQPKLIVALDFDNRADALSLVRRLDPQQCALKVGHEVFSLLGPDFVRELVDRHYHVFLDLKFHDIPNTVARACRVSANLGVWMLNVHASGGLDMMRAAKEAVSHFATPPLLVAVTVLTSMTTEDLNAVGLNVTLEEQVVHLAQLAKEAGLDGVVCSAHEVSLIKKYCGSEFLTVTPGIRMSSSAPDDQSRMMNPEAAIKAGSDYLVIGRPITRATNPKQVVADLLRMCG